MHKIPIYSKDPKYTGFPLHYDKAKNMDIWIDGKKYLDMCHHLGNNMLGYSNDYVNHHVKKCINKGNASLLNHKYMEKLSNLMLGIHPWGEMVRFGNSGGEAMKLVLDLAVEKHEGYNVNVFQVGYSGWHIKNIKNDSFFRIDNINKVNDLLKIDDDDDIFLDRPDILVFELIRHEYPKTETIELLKQWQSQGTILILDEITSGFKFNCGGAHLLYGLEPDICVFSKAIGNGYPISVIIGKDKYMESDLWISSTNWSDGIGFVAAYHTIKALKHCNYKLLVKLGSSIREIWRACATKHKIDISIGEVPQIANFEFRDKHLECKSLFVSEMLKEGILASDQYYPSFTHTSKHIVKYLRACDKAFSKIRRYLDGEKFEFKMLEVLDK